MLKPIILTEDQKKILKIPSFNPILIKGVAGSGKTTIALYRANHLMQTESHLFNNANVVIFTFNKTLVNYIEDIKSKITGYYDHKSEEMIENNKGLKVKVINFHKWAYGFMLDNGESRCNNTVKGKEQENYIKTAIKKHDNLSIAKKEFDFIMSEMAWIKGKLIKTKDEYLNTKRIGRGSSDRLSSSQKEELWMMFEEYNNILKAMDAIDFNDYATICLDIIEKNRYFKPPYTHVVIDEAQDLTKAELLTLRKLVSEETNSITLVADNAQRIYKSAFTWSEVGLDFKGKTYTFKNNYRSTINISKAAQSLLEKENFDNDFTQIDSARRSEFVPVLGLFNSSYQQWKYLKEILPGLISKYNNIVFLHRKRKGVEDISLLLVSHGYNNSILNEGNPDFNSKINVCTLSSIKGLEFDVVIILDCNNGVIPYPEGMKDENREIHISAERRLLYTAMTRAREQLYILTSGEPSPFIEEIDEEFVQKVK